MRLRADFSRSERVLPASYNWVPSPAAGVERMMLDRIGDEVARATSLVRFAPHSRFPAHEHGGGEELLVLEGAFADEYGQYEAGSYLRNPVGSSHAPAIGAQGATLFVKLHQFQSGDDRHFSVQTRDHNWLEGPWPGTEQQCLHNFAHERIMLLRLSPGAALPRPVARGGEEVFVLAGGLIDGSGPCPAGSWLRHPVGHADSLQADADGATLYLKTGHL
ncbi:MAG: cupin domain-containing protein [Xanthomonadales bacterium]|nr:cupin domain-containing protein [Xanthomonadales bacterium]